MEKPTTRDTLWTETFESTLTGGFYVEWNYRDASGELHAGVARSKGEAGQQAKAYGYDPLTSKVR